MFKGMYLSSTTGKSSKSGSDWYRLDLVGTTSSGKSISMQTYCPLSAYTDAIRLEPFAKVEVEVGLNDRGQFEISHLRPAEED